MRRPCGALDEVLERGAHRRGVRVVRVVDQQAAARQLRLLAAPARERHLDELLGQRQAERLDDRERGDRVRGLVARRERERDLAAARSGRSATPSRTSTSGGANRRTSRPSGTNGSSSGESLGITRDAPGGSACSSSAFACATRVNRAQKLQMDRPDVRDHADVGPRDLAERRDLPEAAHPHLGDQHLGVGLEPRQA